MNLVTSMFGLDEPKSTQPGNSGAGGDAGGGEHALEIGALEHGVELVAIPHSANEPRLGAARAGRA